MIAGQQVTPTLRLVRVLGQGGMGSVWVADHLALGTQVAVKFMSSAVAKDPEFVERFRREAQAAAQIKSPHIAQVFDHGMTPDGVPYIVMELLEGEDLKTRVRRLGALPPVEVARIIGQAAKALGRAHQLGIVHRDIKPDNLFLMDVDGEPFVKVLDFGVAKQVLDGNLGVTTTGSILGTPLYMSPEQFLSAKHVDFRADLWALGVVAYFGITGKVPFSGETLGALFLAVHTGVYAPPCTVRPGLPPAINAWMQRTFQRDPAARFGSAKEMAEALEQAVGFVREPMASGWEFSAPVATGAERLGQSNPMSSSSPSGAGVGGSGASGQTFVPIAHTGAGSRRGRAPLVLAGAVLALGAVGGVGFGLLRGAPADDTAPAAGVESPAAASEQVAAEADPADTGAPAAPVPETSTAEPIATPPESTAAPQAAGQGESKAAQLAPAGAGAPRSGQSPALAQPAQAQATARTTPSKPAATRAETKPATTAKAASKPAPTKDTIGF